VKAAKIQCHDLEQACEMYKLEAGDYPMSLEQLLQPNVSGDPFITKLPMTPWGGMYMYQYQAQKPVISATSPRGVTVSNWDD
jgi:hypothetical protein